MKTIMNIKYILRIILLISIFSSSSSKHFFVDKEQTYEEYIYDVVKITFSFIHYLKTYRE